MDLEIRGRNGGYRTTGGPKGEEEGKDRKQVVSLPNSSPGIQPRFYRQAATAPGAGQDPSAAAGASQLSARVRLGVHFFFYKEEAASAPSKYQGAASGRTPPAPISLSLWPRGVLTLGPSDGCC